jgi:hypothetical protein
MSCNNVVIGTPAFENREPEWPGRASPLGLSFIRGRYFIGEKSVGRMYVTSLPN